MTLSSSSSRSLCGWWPPLSRPDSPARQLPDYQQKQPSVMLQGNTHFKSLLQRSEETPPQPQVALHASIRSPHATTAALLAQEQEQQQQRGHEHPQRRCMLGSSTSATVASGGGGSAEDPSSPAPSAANVPVWWSSEGTILPHDDDEDDSFSNGKCRSNTNGSTTDRFLVYTQNAVKAEASNDAAYLADLRRRVAAQVEKRGHGRPAAPHYAAASPVVPSTLSSTSSCGCPTSCTCRTDPPDDGAFGVSVDVHRGATRASRVCHAGRPRMLSGAALRCTYSEFKASATHDMKRFSDTSSETGTTPVHRSSDEESDDLCSSCRCHHRDCGCLSMEWRHAQQSDAESLLKLSSESSTEASRSDGGEDASLCSLCQPAARTRLAGRHGSAASFARQGDSFGKAVHEDTLFAEVPLLLHLSPPDTSCTTKRGNASGARTMAQRGRADHRLGYSHSAAALAAYTDAERRGTVEGVTAGVRALNRSADSTQTDTFAAAAVTAFVSEQQCDPRAKQAEAALKGIAAAHYTEVALPLLQGQLASLEARTAEQQQACFDAVASQMRGYYEEVRQRTQELLDRQSQHQRRLEEQQVTQREEAEAARRVTARADRATSPMQNALAEEAADSTPQAAPSPLPPKRAVGTQHSDGTLELLTAVRTEAASWMAQLLLSVEAERRDAVAQDEAECRDWLLHVVEGTCHCQLLRCQAQVLYWQKENTVVRHQASFAPDWRALDLREQLARQQLLEEAAVAQREMIGSFERQHCQAVEAVAHSQVRLLESEVADVKSKLAILEAEHADTIEHVKQLRLQLIHALRMPTVTLVDRSSVSASTSGAGERAAATAGAGYGDTVDVRGDAHQGTADALASAHVASSPGFATGVVAWRTVPSGFDEGLGDVPVHQRFARAHQEALRVTRAQCRTV